MDFPGHFEQIFQQLNHQRVHGQLCDCVIVVGGRHFKAHRAVLAACSTHFRALFSVSEGDGNVSVIQLDSDVVTGEAFSALVDMMYTSTLSLGESNVMDVLLAASHLHLNAVVKACKHYLNTRTLPKSPLGERGGQANPRLQRSFLLQQLGLSLVSSALNDETEEQGEGSVSRSGLADQRDTFYPPRRLQKRKQGFSLHRSDTDRPWQRPRPASQKVDDGEGGAAAEELLSPDSRCKMVDEDSKPDVVVITGDDRDDYRRAAVPQEDVQLPSQSDGGRVEPPPLLQAPRKEERTHGDGAHAKGGEGVEAHHMQMQVVVKSEPISSPDPADETSDITSQAEGSDQVEPGGEKLELSPDGSDHSFSEPQPSSELLLSEIKGSVDGGERGERAGGFLSVSGYGSAPNPGAAECALEREPPRFLFSSDSSSSMLLPPSQGLFSGEAQDFPGLRPDAVLLRPMHDEHLAAEYQRNGMRALGFPPYRRIAPKIPPGDAQAAQDGLTAHGSGGGGAANPLPQLTRASADVLSKCKKALSEHNVLVVEGARKYACKICCKTFLTLTDCKKHIRVHTGEKPYACLKCGKRFSQSSHLYKHSKTTCLRWQNTNVPNALL